MSSHEGKEDGRDERMRGAGSPSPLQRVDGSALCQEPMARGSRPQLTCLCPAYGARYRPELRRGLLLPLPASSGDPRPAPQTVPL